MNTRDKQAERPNLERYPDVPLYNTKAVVQQTGIAAATLRAWERRYLILSPERTQNAYRLYSERDIATIRWLKAHVDTGLSISQAIALFRHLAEEQGKESQPAIQPENLLAVEETGNSPLTTYDMHVLQEQLLAAFNELDEVTASQLMASALAVYPIEQICTDLITPILWEIGQRWEQGGITVTVEHFASAFFHGLLTNLLHATPTSTTNPLVITCCAPGEDHELAPLMLSLLLRRASLRVVYLGQSIETAGLLQTARHVSPALICVSTTMIANLDAVVNLSQKLQELPPPRPLLIYGGQAFERQAAPIEHISGVYLKGAMPAITTQLRQMALQQVGKGISSIASGKRGKNKPRKERE